MSAVKGIQTDSRHSLSYPWVPLKRNVTLSTFSQDFRLDDIRSIRTLVPLHALDTFKSHVKIIGALIFNVNL